MVMIEILDVREATEEEIKNSQGAGTPREKSK